MNFGIMLKKGKKYKYKVLGKNKKDSDIILGKFRSNEDLREFENFRFMLKYNTYTTKIIHKDRTIDADGYIIIWTDFVAE